MTESQVHSGGCRCGAIRYEASGSPAMVAYCHCEDCRMSSGSVVSVLAGFPRDSFTLSRGFAARYGTAATAFRSFCTVGGSPLFYENDQFAENIYIQVGSMDHPENLPPDRHTWVSDRVSWHIINDDLSCYEKLSNDGLADNTPPYSRP